MIARSPRAQEQPRAWQRMLSGRRLDLLDPSPLDVEIEDIAHGLARVARWNGQTIGDHPFSVAQHSLLVADIISALDRDASPLLRLASLLHDAPEYVIGDMISPFKAVIGSEYRDVEQRLTAAVHRRFGLPVALPAAMRQAIKSADRIAAYHEATQLAGFAAAEARRFFGAPGIAAARLDLEPWPTQTAEDRFKAAFEDIFAVTQRRTEQAR